MSSQILCQKSILCQILIFVSEIDFASNLDFVSEIDFASNFGLDNIISALEFNQVVIFVKSVQRCIAPEILRDGSVGGCRKDMCSH